MYQMTKMNVHTLGAHPAHPALSPTNEPIDIRLRAPELSSASPNYRPPPRPVPLPLPDPLAMPQRPSLDLDRDHHDHHDHHPEPVEPLRISFHEDDRDIRGSRHSLARSCKSGHEECILPPGPFEVRNPI